MKIPALLTAITLLALPMAARADEPGQHPAYLHALSNMRSAYWLISHRGTNDPIANANEHRALDEIRFAYAEVNRAAIDDGKNLEMQPPPDMTWGDHSGRLHRALDLLRDADNDVHHEEDDPTTRGLRNRAVRHLDAAALATSNAIRDLRFRGGS